ncbi:MAG: hypothetical protein HOV94_38970 [Saccharothrix sp.]|nr:hypothetical protein [Saccharothrix sp.]
MIGTGQDVDPRVFLVPGSGLGTIVGAAWGGPTGGLGLAAVSVVGWTAVAVFLAVRFFRWEPRR